MKQMFSNKNKIRLVKETLQEHIRHHDVPFYSFWFLLQQLHFELQSGTTSSI